MVIKHGRISGGTLVKLPKMLQARLFPIKKGDGRPMFLVHGIGGTALLFPTLSKHLSENSTVFALQAKGLDGVSPIDETIEDMATTYIEAIKEVQPEGPYQVAGYSHGSHIAFEIGQQLAAAGDEVKFLGILDHPAPTAVEGRVFHQVTDVGNTLKRYSSRFVEMAKTGGLKKVVPAIRRRLKVHSNAGNFESVEDIIDMEGWPDIVKKVAHVHFEASRYYMPKPYPGRIDLFCTPNSIGHPQGWELLTEDKVVVHKIPGSHETIFYEPHVEEFCKTLEPLLD